MLQKYVEEKLNEKAQSDSDLREFKDNRELIQLLSDNAEDVLDATFDLILGKTLLEWGEKLEDAKRQKPQRPQSELDKELELAELNKELKLAEGDAEASEAEILEQMKAFMPEI